MKKIALTSLLAVFAVSGAHAANVIDGNPLYMPKAGHHVSETALSSHSNPDVRTWALAEDFGYGVTDHFAIDVATSLSEKRGFEEYNWDGLKLGATYRALDMGGWKADLVAAYEAAGFYLNRPAQHLDGTSDSKWFDKDATQYLWTAGVRGGYVANSWTIAGHALYNYLNSESFNWGNHGMHAWALGLDAQYIFTSHFNMVAGVEYAGVTNDNKYMGGIEGRKMENEGVWTGTLAANFNIDATKYVGLYINGTLNHWKGEQEALRSEKGWGFEKGFGGGVKFGIDF